MTDIKIEHQRAIDCSQQLVKALTHSNQAAVASQLNELVKIINSTFHINPDNADISQEILSKLPEQFNYIKAQMFDGVSMTISETENALHSISKMNDLKENIGHNLANATHIEHAEAINDHFRQFSALSGELHIALNNILLAQTYQDLCGQVINRTGNQVDIIIKMLEQLVMLEALPEKIKTDSIAANGPLISKDDNAVDQSDIDSLFGSLDDD